MYIRLKEKRKTDSQENMVKKEWKKKGTSWAGREAKKEESKENKRSCVKKGKARG